MVLQGGALRRWTRRDKRVWKRKQKAAAPGRYYGGMGTIHATSTIDIEVSPSGAVVSCWFRCQMIPFEAREVSQERADEMIRAFEDFNDKVALTGVEVQDRAVRG